MTIEGWHAIKLGNQPIEWVFKLYFIFVEGSVEEFKDGDLTYFSSKTLSL